MKLYAWNAFGCSLIFSAVWELPAKNLQILQNNLLFTYKFKKKVDNIAQLLHFGFLFKLWSLNEIYFTLFGWPIKFFLLFLNLKMIHIS